MPIRPLAAVLRAMLVLSGLSACSPAQLLNATVPDRGVSVTRDVAYAPGPRHMLDIYRPARPSGALIVFLYGGGWRGGDKATYAFVGLPLAQKGAVVVVPDYRVYPQVRFPAFLDDCAQAVAWAVAHAAELGASRVFLMGHSAGAYNALMLALDPRYLAAAGTSRERLAGVIGLAGPYDFLPITDPDVVPIFATVDDGPASQPVSFVDGHNPPLLLLAGSDDMTVLPRNTVSLARRVGAAGGMVQSRIYPGIGHVGLVTAFAPVFDYRAPALEDVWTFVRARSAPVM